MIARFLILVVIIHSTLAQSTIIATTTANPNAITTTTATTTTTLSSSSPSSSLSSSIPAVSASMGSPPQNCSACMQQFQKIYLNVGSNQTSNETSTSTSYWNDSMKCPPIMSLNDPCVSIVNTDNCSVILNLIYTSNSNVSFGLTCSATGMRVVKWANCTMGESETLRLINESSENFCRMGGGGGGGAAVLNCSEDNNGIRRINKVSVLEPFRKMKYCAPPTTGKPTIPLLPNPVGPSAITAIVVLVCLFITAVLAGFFFWPKCHMSKPPPPTKKKQQPTTEAFNVVAYSAATHSPTGAANVSISVGPNQLGPAAA